MSEFRFTDGNLFILYGINRGKSADGELPDHIKERVKVCLGTFNIIMKSKPDKQKTLVSCCRREIWQTYKRGASKGRNSRKDNCNRLLFRKCGTDFRPYYRYD